MVVRVMHCSKVPGRGGRLKAEGQLTLCSLSQAQPASLLVIPTRVPSRLAATLEGGTRKEGGGVNHLDCSESRAHKHFEMCPLERLETDGCVFIVTGCYTAITSRVSGRLAQLRHISCSRCTAHVGMLLHVVTQGPRLMEALPRDEG